nr:hypothetical protein L203_03097 [Cryptococcus depauperatus CBS 7841]
MPLKRKSSTKRRKNGKHTSVQAREQNTQPIPDVDLGTGEFDPKDRQELAKTQAAAAGITFSKVAKPVHDNQFVDFTHSGDDEVELYRREKFLRELTSTNCSTSPEATSLNETAKSCLSQTDPACSRDIMEFESVMSHSRLQGKHFKAQKISPPVDVWGSKAAALLTKHKQMQSEFYKSNADMSNDPETRCCPYGNSAHVHFSSRLQTYMDTSPGIFDNDEPPPVWTPASITAGHNTVSVDYHNDDDSMSTSTVAASFNTQGDDNINIRKAKKNARKKAKKEREAADRTHGMQEQSTENIKGHGTRNLKVITWDNENGMSNRSSPIEDRLVTPQTGSVHPLPLSAFTTEDSVVGKNNFKKQKGKPKRTKAYIDAKSDEESESYGEGDSVADMEDVFTEKAELAVKAVVVPNADVASSGSELTVGDQDESAATDESHVDSENENQMKSLKDRGKARLNHHYTALQKLTDSVKSVNEAPSKDELGFTPEAAQMVAGSVFAFINTNKVNNANSLLKSNQIVIPRSSEDPLIPTPISTKDVLKRSFGSTAGKTKTFLLLEDVLESLPLTDTSKPIPQGETMIGVSIPSSVNSLIMRLGPDGRPPSPRLELGIIAEEGGIENLQETLETIPESRGTSSTPKEVPYNQIGCEGGLPEDVKQFANITFEKTENQTTKQTVNTSADSNSTLEQPTTIYRIPGELSSASILPNTTCEPESLAGPIRPVFKVERRGSETGGKITQRPSVLERTMSGPASTMAPPNHPSSRERSCGGLKRSDSFNKNHSHDLEPQLSSSIMSSPEKGARQFESYYTDPNDLYKRRHSIEPSYLPITAQLLMRRGSLPPESHLHGSGSPQKCLPLERSWTMYYSDSSDKLKAKANWQSAHDYNSALLTVFHGKTIEDILGSWKAVRRAIAESKGRIIEQAGAPMQGGGGLGIGYMPEDTNFHLFADGIKPMWEDEMCTKGGKIMITGDASSMDIAFLEICFLLIGGNLQDAVPSWATPSKAKSVICGAVISRRKVTRLEIWLGGRDGPDPAWVEQVYRHIERYFPTVRILPFKSFGKG